MNIPNEPQEKLKAGEVFAVFKDELYIVKLEKPKVKPRKKKHSFGKFFIPKGATVRF